MKLENSKAWLKLKFIDQGKTIEEIAIEASCSSSTIRRALKREGFIK